QALDLYATPARARARFDEYAALGRYVRSALRSVGIAPLAGEAHAAPVLITFRPPAGWTAERFRDHCPALGYELAGAGTVPAAGGSAPDRHDGPPRGGRLCPAIRATPRSPAGRRPVASGHAGRAAARRGNNVMPAGAPLDLRLWRLARAVLRPFVALYYHIEVRHRTRLPRDGMALITPTHRSRWDHLMVSWAIPRLVFFLASEDDCVGVQRWLMRRLGAIPLNRERPGAGALRLCRTLLLGGHSLVIYPEGGIFRYPKGEVHPLKPG